MLDQLRSDYAIAFAEEITPQDFVDVPPIRIQIKKVADPYRATTARPYPVGRESDCRAIIKQLETSGIIRRHEEVTDWCSRAFFVPKQNGGLRLVVDFRQINAGCNRIGIPFDSNRDIFQQIPDAACAFLTPDLTSFFFQL